VTYDLSSSFLVSTKEIYLKSNFRLIMILNHFTTEYKKQNKLIVPLSNKRLTKEMQDDEKRIVFNVFVMPLHYYNTMHPNI